MIRYIVSALEPKSHLLDVELSLDTPSSEKVLVSFPAWVPGHYVIEDFAGLARGEHALGDGGRPLPCRKIDKATFEILPGKSRSVSFRFQTWSYTASTHRSLLDEERLTLNGGHVFPFVAGRDREPSEVEFRLPEGWNGPYIGLEPVKGKKHTFRADGYDELLDCPAMAGKPHVSEFAIEGVPHFLVIQGRGNVPYGLFASDVEKISRQAASMFGKVPYKHYHYLLDLSSARGGGLEHRNSTHCMLGRFSFHPRANYVDSLALMAHEFFHTWNVKRLRPHPLGPFDYTREVHTPLLWFAEGVTSYYEKVVMRRAGVITPREFVDLVAREIQWLQLVPGRRYQTVESSSNETWVKFYKRGPHTHNAQVSYYNKGSLAGLVLDMELRARTGNKKSLDHLMKRMYDEYYLRQERGFHPGELEEEASKLAGESLAPFFEKTLRSTEELDFKRALSVAGLELARLDKRGPDGEVVPAPNNEPMSYLGIGLQLGKALTLDNIMEGGPAHDAGLAPGDEILAIDRLRMTPGRMEGVLAETPPGTKLEVLVDRSGELKEYTLITAPRDGIAISIRPKEKATPQQAAVYKSWAKADLAKLDRTSPAVQQRERDRVG